MAAMSAVEPLPDGLVEALSDRGAYPDDPSAVSGVEHVQTHLSHVFLSAERVYKLHKAAVFDFVDFGTRSRRNADCLRELKLNRRLAPDVYLGIAAIQGKRVGPPREELAEDREHVILMRRLPAGRDGLSLLQTGGLSEAMLECLAERLARFHAANSLGQPAPFEPDEWRDSIVKPARENFEVLREAEPDELRAQIEEASARAESFFREHADEFERRRRDGRAVDGHGDLHLQHVWYEDPEAPCVIDCVAFRDDFRCADAASDIAFLAMDLEYRERADLAEHFVRSYAARADDFDLYPVLPYYISYRAAVRAKVAALAAHDPDLPGEQRARARGSAQAHLRLAQQALRPRGRGSLVVLCGRIGTGKSSAAAALAAATGGVTISSDQLRKHLAGMARTERTGDGVDRGLYAPEAREAVYDAMLERAERVVASGRVALLDATHAARTRREEVRRWADERGVPAFLLETTCPDAVTRHRLEARAKAGHDPSDAGPELMATSAAAYESPEEWPAEQRERIDTSTTDWRSAVEAIGKRWASGS